MFDYVYLVKMERMQRQIHLNVLSRWNAASAVKLSMPQLQVLSMLERDGPLMLSQLADGVCLSPEGAVFLAEKMIEKGLLQQVGDTLPADTTIMKLSAEGHRAVQSIRGLRGELAEQMFEGLDPEELKAMDHIYTTVLRNLEKQPDNQLQPEQ